MYGIKTKQLPMQDATDQQLYDFAESLQLEPGIIRDRPGLTALLSPAWQKPYIVVPDVEEPNAEQSQAVEGAQIVGGGMAGGRGANDPKVRCKVATTQYAGGNQPVPVSVNGKLLIIQRDQEIDLPYRYFLALEQAVRTEVTQTEDRKDFIYTNFTAYPLQVTSRPSEAEIAAWHAETDKQLMPA